MGMENDFLDVDVAQPHDRPQTSELLQKLVAWAVITALDVHPTRESMAPLLVYKRVGKDDYESEIDENVHTSMEAVFDGARKRLAKLDDVEGYVLIVDSVDRFEGFPAQRPKDLSGRDYSEDQPTIAAYLGEMGEKAGVLAIQPYRIRRLRGGATPLGAPLIIGGPDSLLWEHPDEALDGQAPA